MATEDIRPASGPARMPRNYCWIPTIALEPGMVIAIPVFGGPGNKVTIHLAVGSAITANTIAQLVNRGVECVAVLQEIPPNESLYAQAAQRHESRLREIFGPDPDENCKPLFEALLAEGPSPC